MKKFRKITFKHHPVLGNLSLDFCDDSGRAVDTVILAGENGCGKSTILNCLYDLTFKWTSICGEVESVELEKDSDIIFLESEEVDNIHGVKGKFNIAKFKTKSGESPNLLTDYKYIFSDVDINFHSSPINIVTSENIDMQKNSRRSDTNLTKQINQLIVDVQALDDAELARLYRETKEKGEDTNIIIFENRMERFKKAFSKMFENMTYDRVENIDGLKSIIFKKNGQDIPIENLSSGEKQIVYRGCFLLKDVNALNGAIVFIDEPEISLHPTWQNKIMDYYKGIFTDENGVQTSQIFVVTHSPFIIHNENRRNDKVIVLARDEQGNIVVKDKPEYYNCDSLEVVEDAFSIKDFSAGQPTVYLEGRTDERYFNKALEVFGYKDIPFVFKWIGHIDNKGEERFTGATSLNHALDFLILKNLPYKNVLLYDCDTNKPSSEQNNVFTRKIEKYPNVKGMEKGIENALILDAIDITPFYQPTKTDGYGGYKVEFQKMAFCEYICELKDLVLLRSVFANLEIEIKKLVNLFRES